MEMNLRVALLTLMQRIGTESPLNRRKHERVSVLQQIHLVVEGRPGWINGSVIDCSDTGLGLLSPEPVEPGSKVVVDWKRGYFLGVCRNCHPSGQVWRVGIEMETANCHGPLVEELQRMKWG